jgi:hypothetical protein
MPCNFLSAAPPVSRVQATPAQSTLPKPTCYFPRLSCVSRSHSAIVRLVMLRADAEDVRCHARDTSISFS